MPLSQVDPAIQFDGVYKKFRRGELFDSLRDLVPALVGRIKNKNEIEKNRKEFWALNDVTFKVNRGEAFGIIGHNGAGKSTLLKHLTGIMNPSRGSIKINGRLSALIEVGAGFHPDLTGRENIFLNGTILGMKKAEIKRKLDEIIDFSGLADFMDTPVKRYSSGMYARLGFAVAAHVEPDILVIDEVLSVGDHVFQRKSVNKMMEIIKSGVTVVFVSHNLRAVAELCDRTILMDHGQIVNQGKTEDVVRAYLDSVAENRGDTDQKNVFIKKVIVRDSQGERLRFESGKKCWVDIYIKANATTEKFSIIFNFQDKEYYTVFQTSSERLGSPPISLQAGQEWKVTFEVDLHFAQGMFLLQAAIYRHDIQKVYDIVFPAATIYVGATEDIGGVVNLYPKVVASEPAG